MLNRGTSDSLSAKLTSLALFSILFAFPCTLLGFSAGGAVCELSAVDGNKLFNYSLASPLPNFPHGVLSEDGFYKVAANGTVLWFQLCDGMIFNHDPPKCFDCSDCGGSARCGMGCSAVIADNIKGYHVCSTIGSDSSFDIDLIDQKNPHMGVIVKMTSSRTSLNCSLSVSILCDWGGVRRPETLQKLGACEYATELRHPAGCATIAFHGRRWGWFAVLSTILLSTLGAYLLAGVVYRYFFLKVRGVDVIPDLDFWTGIPQRTQSVFSSTLGKFRGPTYNHRSSYSPVDF